MTHTLGYCPLASGSRGNSIYVGTARTKILIDAGLNIKKTQERLASLGVSLEDIDAIVISHEHSDHIQGLKHIAAKYQIPILANCETAKGIVYALGFCPKFKIFTTGETFQVGDIAIHPFTVQHDTLDPVAFTLQFDGLKVGICTDLGFATSSVEYHLQKCNYLYLEANHDVDMVHASNRSHSLKQRILGRSGHLSNADCGELLCRLAHADLRHVHLAHLSNECNAPQRALDTVMSSLNTIGIQIPLDIAPQETSGRTILF